MPRDTTAYGLQRVSDMLFNNSTYFVTSASNFPAPSGGVITLPINSSWFIFGQIDLGGSRLVASGNVTLIGMSTDNSSIRSTGLTTGSSLITSSDTVTINTLTLGCPSDCNILNLTGNGSKSMTWSLVNFGSTSIGCGSCGTINGYNNCFFDKCAFGFCSDGLTFSGSFNSIVFTDCSFASTLIANQFLSLTSTLVIGRRIRLTDCIFLVPTGKIGVLYNAAVTIPDEGLRVYNTNFSGTGTYLSGISPSNIKGWFTGCRGVANSTTNGVLRIVDNNTATTISATNTWTTIAGTTSFVVSERMTNTAQAVVRYDGPVTKQFSVILGIVVVGNNNVEVGGSFLVNGAQGDNYGTHITTTGSGALQYLTATGIVTLNQNDTLTVVVQNRTNTTSITVHDMTFTVYELSN